MGCLGTNHDFELCSMSIRARALSWTLTATTAVVVTTDAGPVADNELLLAAAQFAPHSNNRPKAIAHRLDELPSRNAPVDAKSTSLAKA
jgi:hypothetical protein